MEASCVVVLVNVVLMVMQFAAAWISGSHSVLADGAHTLIDVLGDGIVAVAIYFDQANRSGRALKLTPVATVLVNLLIVATGVELLIAGLVPHAAQSAGARPPLALAALAVAITSLVAKAGLYRYLRAAAAQAKRREGESLASALNASAWHARADSMASGIAAIGATGMLAGLPAVDRSGTALIGVLILVAGVLQNAAALRSLPRRLARMNWNRRPDEHPGRRQPAAPQA